MLTTRLVISSGRDVHRQWQRLSDCKNSSDILSLWFLHQACVFVDIKLIAGACKSRRLNQRQRALQTKLSQKICKIRLILCVGLWWSYCFKLFNWIDDTLRGGHICSGINPIVTKTDQRYHANILFDYVSCQQDVKEPYDVLPIKDIFRCFCFVLYYNNLI